MSDSGNEKIGKCTEHQQEKIISSYQYKNIDVDIVEWPEAIWCGKAGYATDTLSEPDVEKIMDAYQAIDFPTRINERIDCHWDACLSLNYLSKERPNGIMFASLVANDKQEDCFDVFRVPSARYLRIQLNEDTAKSLGHEPWHGGIPPFHWIYDEIAPAIGYTYGEDTLPIFEYYGYYNPEKYEHEFCFLYVPIKKN